MIPASYLFKDMYHQHWEEAAQLSGQKPERHLIGSMLTPALDALRSLPNRQPKAGRQYFGTHVYR